MADSSRHKILVFSMTRMGDIIQSIPFFRRLRLANPHSKIVVLVERCFQEAAAMLPDVDRIWPVKLEDILLCFEGPEHGSEAAGLQYYRQLVQELQHESFDEVWNLTHTRPFTVLSALVGGEETRGVTIDQSGMQTVNEPWLRYFYATNLARPWCQFNLVDIYANCVRHVPVSAGRDITIARAFYKNAATPGCPPRTTRRRVAIHPGASQRAKQWPVAHFAKVASMLAETDIEILLIGGKGDGALAHTFADIRNSINLIGKTDLRQLAKVLAECDLLISNDSGPMHVAAGVGTPVVAVTLGSALGSETAPYGRGHWIIEPWLDCYPCESGKPCSTQRCADLIEPELIVEIANAALHNTVLPKRWRQSEQVRLFRTEFDSQDQQLILRRIGEHPVDSRESAHRSMRRFWPAWLDNLNRPVPSIPDVRAEFSQAFAELHDLANNAAALCRELETESKHRANLLRRAMQLEQVERDIKTACLKTDLLRTDVLRSVYAYLHIEKSSVRGTNVEAQARETAEIYERLASALQVIARQTPESITETNLV